MMKVPAVPTVGAFLFTIILLFVIDAESLYLFQLIIKCKIFYAMADNSLIQFLYRSKNGVVEPKDCIANLYSEFIIIKGQLTRTLFDPVSFLPVKMTGLYIEYKGTSYGSITTNLDQLMAQLGACPCPETEFRLFDIEFDFEFE